MAFAMSSARSAFVGQGINCQSRIGGSASRVSVVVQSKKVCDLLGTKRNKANTVSFSNKRSRKWQEPNLQNKRIYWPAGQRWVSLKLSTRAIKTIEKNGLDAMAKEANIDLWKLPFVDNRPERKEYLEHNKGKVPVAENPRAMKNPEKIAASKKPQRYPIYDEGGRIVWIRPGEEEKYQGAKHVSAVSDAPGTAPPSVAAPALPRQLNITVTQ